MKDSTPDGDLRKSSRRSYLASEDVIEAGGGDVSALKQAMLNLWWAMSASSSQNLRPAGRYDPALHPTTADPACRTGARI